MSGLPGPQEEPELYDSFDFPERAQGWVNPVATPPELQDMLEARKAQKPAADGGEEPEPSKEQPEK